MPCTYCEADGPKGCPIHVGRLSWSFAGRLALLCAVIVIVDVLVAVGVFASIEAIR